jgi:general secretion pathway protein I
VPRCAPDRRGQQGFTLVEVLAALAVLGIVLAVAWRVIGGGLLALERGEARAAALALAEARLAEAGTAAPLVAGHTEGQWQGRRWQVAVEPRADGVFAAAAGRGLAALQVTVTVWWEDSSLSLTTTRLVVAP